MAEPALNIPDLDAGITPDDGAAEPAELSLRDELDKLYEGERAEPTDEVRGDPRARDELGRFTPAAKAAQAAQARQQATQATDPTQGAQPRQPRAPGPATPAPTPDLKPPQSWTPSGRETWAQVPPVARQEIHRREGEMQHLLQESAANRSFVSAFEGVIRPYEMFIRGENSSPLQAVANMMATAAELRVGTPLSKANLIANLITNFGIDVRTLDDVLAGKTPDPSRVQSQQPVRDPRVDQLLAMQQQQAVQAEATEAAALRDGLQEFGARHEFYKDVAATMADIVEVRARQKQPIDLEQIYRQACALDTGISTIINQRAQAQAGQRSQQAVLRARRAAVSVRNEATPHGATLPRDDSIRASLEAAYEQQENL